MTPSLRIAGIWAMSVIGALPGCRQVVGGDVFELASVYLTCWPVMRGVQCQLLALSRDVRQPPRDATHEASWHFSGMAGAQLSTTGIVEADRDGDVSIDVDYQSRTAHRMVRLIRGRPGQLLAVVRGRALLDDHGSLRGVPGVRVEVVSGPDAGKAATTARDGTYELAGLTPGLFEMRATKPGYESTDMAVSIESGEAHVSVLLRALIDRDDM